MLKPNRKRIVVDADIVSVNQYPKECRKFMNDILNICHHVVLSEPILTEWKNHQLDHYIRWRGSLVEKNKECFIAPEQFPDIKIKIISNTPEDKLEPVLKDYHLIDAALATDKIIISLDNHARKAYSKISAQVKELKQITWLDPADVNINEITTWLNKGAKPKKEWKLTSFEK